MSSGGRGRGRPAAAAAAVAQDDDDQQDHENDMEDEDEDGDQDEDGGEPQGEDEDQEGEVPEEVGYTTAGATSGDDDDEAEYFARGLDVDHLLQVMTDPEAGALQPYEILRRQRAAQQRIADDEEEARERLANRPRRKAAHVARARSAAAAEIIGPAAGDESGSDFSLDEADDSDEDEGGLELAKEGGRGVEQEQEEEAWDAEGLEIGASGEIKAKRKSKWARRHGGKSGRSLEVPEHISRMVGHANLLYASNKYQEAVQILLEVIRSVPNLRDPYRTLGALHEVMGQPRQALNFFIIAAHMGKGKQDTNLWHKLALMSEEQGFIRQAIYCWNKVLSRDKDDFDSMLARARLYPLIGEAWRARTQLSTLLTRAPGHPEVVKALAALYHECGQPGKAVELLEAQLAQHYSQADLTHINMLTDLYMGMGHYGDAVALINRSEVVMCQGEPLPIDLRVRRGVCLAHMCQLTTAQQDLDALKEHPVVDEDGESYVDLYLMVLQECNKAGQAALAVPCMDALRDAPGVMEEPEQWQVLADGYCAAGLTDAAIALVTDKLGSLGKAHERYMECSLYLARMLVSIGEAAAASDILQQLDADVEQHELNLPEGQGAQLSLLLTKASLHLQLGQRDAFATSLLPQFTSLLEQAETNAAVVTAAKRAARSGRVPRDLVKALKRRKMFARKGGRKGEGGFEADSVFKGYVSRDRRKAYVVEADKAADHLLKRAAAARKAGAAGGAVSGAETEAEGDATDGEGAAGEGGDALPADLPAELTALVTAATTDQSELPDLFGDPQIFGAFTELVSVLRADGRNEEAGSLLSRASTLANARGSALNGGWWGPSATAPKQRKAAPGAVSEGDVSDWGPNSKQQLKQGQGGREEMQALKDSLRMMAADVALSQGDTEEAAKLLRSLLMRWPCSWSAWSMFCCLCSQSGRLGSWLKHVALLRARHPDSLALQVLAAHADNLSGDQASACSAYAAALQQLPDEPLLLLSLGCSLIDAALSKGGGAGASSSSAVGADRNATLLRGFAALHTYARARGPAAEAEASYNLGRAAHRIGLLHVAVAHYERVLQLSDEAAAAAVADSTAQQLQGLSIKHQQQQQPSQQQQQQSADDMQIDAPGTQQQQQQQEQQQQTEQKGSEGLGTQKLSQGLAREAAHNLVLIYRGSGAHDLARHVMRQYLTI